MNTTDNPKKIRLLTIRVDDDLYQKISSLAEYNDMPKSYIMRLLINVCLEIGFYELIAIYTKKVGTKNV